MNERLNLLFGQRDIKHGKIIIWGDDIGWYNPSCYHRGIMGLSDPQHDPHR